MQEQGWVSKGIEKQFVHTPSPFSLQLLIIENRLQQKWSQKKLVCLHTFSQFRYSVCLGDLFGPLLYLCFFMAISAKKLQEPNVCLG